MVISYCCIPLSTFITCTFPPSPSPRRRRHPRRRKGSDDCEAQWPANARRTCSLASEYDSPTPSTHADSVVALLLRLQNPGPLVDEGSSSNVDEVVESLHIGVAEASFCGSEFGGGSGKPTNAAAGSSTHSRV